MARPRKFDIESDSMKPVKKSSMEVAKVVKKQSESDRWETLIVLIDEFRDAAVEESWKGGGDPADADVLEARLNLATATLNSHIEKMRRELEQ